MTRRRGARRRVRRGSRRTGGRFGDFVKNVGRMAGNAAKKIWGSIKANPVGALNKAIAAGNAVRNAYNAAKTSGYYRRGRTGGLRRRGRRSRTKGAYGSISSRY